MTYRNLGDEPVDDVPPKGQLYLGGTGTLQDPFRASALREHVLLMQQRAREANTSMYWNHNGTFMRIDPNKGFEYEYRTEPLPGDIEADVRSLLGDVLPTQNKKD